METNKYGQVERCSHFANEKRKSCICCSSQTDTQSLPKVYLTVYLSVCLSASRFICCSMALPGSFIKYLAPAIVHIVKCKYETDVEVVECICYRACLCVSLYVCVCVNTNYPAMLFKRELRLQGRGCVCVWEWV